MNIIPPALAGSASLPARLIRPAVQCHRHCESFRRQSQHRSIHDRTKSNPFTNNKRPREGLHSPTSQCNTLGTRAFSSSPSTLATKDPYATLGVGREATAADIKKAYYAMAKKYHPDTNKDPTAKEKFTDAQSAYELLNDPQKKAAWDQFGNAAFDQGGGFNPGAAGGNPFAGAGGANPFSGFGGGFGADFNFEDLFGAFTGGARRGRGRSPYQEEILVGENIEVQANISFMDAAKGVAKNISITPLVGCDTCKGEGLKKGSTRQTCKRCNGTGTRVHVMQQGFQMASTCEACGGQGVVIPRGAECGTCSGNGVVRQRKSVKVDIPGGVEDGMRLRVSGEGDAPPTGLATNPKSRSQRGDLYVFIRVAPDARFGRNGADVLYTASIPLTTALLGGEVLIPTLDGEVKVKVATGTGTGDKITLGGMGMKRLGGRGPSAGDLRVEFKVNMPKYLSANQRTILEMLADEMGDKTAKRLMNVGQFKSTSKPTDTSSDSSPKQSPSSASKKESDHKNEGFLRSAWHKLTHQHDNLESEPEKTPDASSNKAKPESAKDEDEPKKASGSG